MAEYSLQKINQIKNAIDKALENGAKPIAAFDADGTLWDTDMGEKFFHFQINNGLLPKLSVDPLTFYENKYKEDAKAAFLWLVQVNRGRSLTEIKKWAYQSYSQMGPIPYFKSVLEILKYLQNQKVKIYIVTASMKWSVEPAAEFLQIPPECILGVTTKIKQGILTDELEGILTWQDGKAQRLLSEISPEIPFFCGGNTLGDLALLEASSHIRMVNCALPPNHMVYESEQKLIAIAKERNWFYHTYKTPS